jgi:hypothetical protein
MSRKNKISPRGTCVVNEYEDLTGYLDRYALFWKQGTNTHGDNSNTSSIENRIYGRPEEQCAEWMSCCARAGAEDGRINHGSGEDAPREDPGADQEYLELSRCCCCSTVGEISHCNG